MLRRILIVLALALGSTSVANAQSVVGTYFLDSGTRSISGLVSYGTATSTAGCTVGVKGCMASADFNGVTSVSLTPGSSLAQPPYPARIIVMPYDASSNGTLACTGQTITGVNAAGFTMTETMGALSESGDTTDNVFASVSAYAATGCSGGAASDVINVRLQEEEVGVPVYLSGTSDVLAVCLRSTTSAWHCARSGFTVVGGGYAVNLTGATWEGTSIGLAPDQQISLSYRGKRFYRYLGGR